MTSYLTRETHSYSHCGTQGSSRKKIKNYSYSSTDKIGKGFSSIVYRGTNDNTNEVVAIKAIDMKGVRDAVSREMLDCEIQALTKLKHPNILKCYDVIRETSHCFIVTEFCNEGDLSSLLKKRRKMTEQQVLKIMRDIVSGFLEIGQNKFLHRDLKLANIFMSNGVAKIADFGFAKKSHSSFEREKYNVGSPLYMSPEALKKNIYSTKNDIWSIGIMIYEMLHGETPWECRTENQLIQKMTKIPVKFRETIFVSQEVKDFIKHCLEVDQTKRMGLTDLRQWCSNNNFHPNPNCISEHEIGGRRASLFPNQLGVHMNQNENRVVKPLGDVTNTNRHLSNVQKTRSMSNVMPKYQLKTNECRNNNSNAYKDKQNNNLSGMIEKKPKLSKIIIEKNNSVLLIEINKFRLFYKIYQKIKHLFHEQKHLMQVLGYDILRRVDTVAQIILNGSSQMAKLRANELGLKELDSYLRQETNSSIKKYVSVIKEYQRKYKSQITSTGSYHINTVMDMLKKFLTTVRYSKQWSKQEALLYYWVVEAVSLRIDVQKDELDKIIEGKFIPTKDIMTVRIKEFM